MAISISAEGDLRAEHVRASHAMGVARPCMTYAGELARDRVVTPDGQDYIVTTAANIRAGSGFLTGAYPVSRGYLVMMRQPLAEFHSATEDEAREMHLSLASVLAEAGARVVRARASLLARKRAETREAKAARKPRIQDDEPLGAIVETAPAKETFASLN
jgi:hypothetical protein